MSLAIADNRISEEHYLQGELASEIRHEYVAGQAYAVSGGTLDHQRIAGNFFYLFKKLLVGKPCFPTGSDRDPSPTALLSNRGGMLGSQGNGHSVYCRPRSLGCA